MTIKTLYLWLIAIVLMVIIGVVAYYVGTTTPIVTTKTVSINEVQTVYHTTTVTEEKPTTYTTTVTAIVTQPATTITVTAPPVTMTTTQRITTTATVTATLTTTTTQTVSHITTATLTTTATQTVTPLVPRGVDMIATVYNVVDGDTFDGFPSGRVRLADIDAPERGEKGYTEAKEALKLLTLNKVVYLDVDDMYVMDSYNRLVCVVYVEYNSTHLLNVNRWLVVNGFATLSDYPNEFNPYTWSIYVAKESA